MKDLSTLSTTELQTFFNSFDYVLSDVDGVLWNVIGEIPGTSKAIKSLKKIGKKVIMVSNNTTKSLDFYHRQLIKAGFDITKEELVTPTLTTIAYLKKQNLQDKEIFVIGMQPLRTELQKAGFTLAKNVPDRIPESLSAFVTAAVVDEGKVGAVVADVDINLNYLNLQKAATFLDRPEVLFLKGPPDRHLPVGDGRVVIGPGYFVGVLEDITQREGVAMAKPGAFLGEYVKEKFGIGDPRRVLFVGDSIPSDMMFATDCQFKTLLVLSGLTKRQEVMNWKYPEKYKPDFYAESLKTVHECIQRCFSSRL